MLVPYRSKNPTFSIFNPFHDFDSLERAFFSDHSISEFKTDIHDDGDAYILESDLPGFAKDDIHIDLNGSTLTIHAQRHSDFEDTSKKNGYIRCERSYGSYSRSFDTTGIDKDAIRAKYENGVLKLTLPKQTQQSASTRLPIE